jgi:hypothetical protein
MNIDNCFKGKNQGLQDPSLFIDFDDVLFPKRESQIDLIANITKATGGKDLFTPVYQELRTNNGGFVDIQEICAEVRKRHQLSFDLYKFFQEQDLLPYQKQIDESIAFLETIKSRKIPFKIITQGNHEYQRLKLEKSGIIRVIDPETQLIISEKDKLPVLEKEIIHLPKTKNCLVIDDKAEVLVRLNELLRGKREITTCKVGPWTDEEAKLYSNSSYIDFQVTGINRLMGLLRNETHEGKPPLENIPRR